MPLEGLISFLGRFAHKAIPERVHGATNTAIGGINDRSAYRKSRSSSTHAPVAVPAANKKVALKLTDQNGVTFTARINAKSWRKAETDATTFSDWGGAVSGKLGQPTDNGFEVVDAGIKVFEKKAKEPKPEETTIGADAAPIV